MYPTVYFLFGLATRLHSLQNTTVVVGSGKGVASRQLEQIVE